jgi:hypothetical protein
MERRNDVSITKLFAGLTLAVCIAAVFDPRLRKACFSLLCKL